MTSPAIGPGTGRIQPVTTAGIDGMVRSPLNQSTFPLWESAVLGHTADVQQMIIEGVDVNETGRCRSYETFIWPHMLVKTTPLQVACQGLPRPNRPAMVRMLLGARADVRATGDTGKSALYYAVANGCLLSVKLLIVESDVNAKTMDNTPPTTMDGCTPLHMAAMHGHADIVTALLEAKANLYAQNSLGRIPIQYGRHDPDTKDVLEKAMTLDKCVAFASSSHPRIGEQSVAKNLDPAIIRMILKMI
jgi:hypothetical protein